MTRRPLAALAVAALALLAVPATASARTAVIVGAGDPAAIPGSYLVRYDGPPRVDLADKYGVRVRHRFSAALNGFAATMDEATARRIAAEPGVAHVEQDRWVHPAVTQTPVPSWGLDRVDQPTLPLDNSFTYNASGLGTTVYVIDTGIRLDHLDLIGRASFGVNTTFDPSDDDCFGHGTHVAGTTGGTVHGVAKDVQLVAVKVFPCIGAGVTDVISGVDWVTANAVGPAVATMSMAAAASPTLDAAVAGSIAAGITYVVAAGNNNGNACSLSPARVPEAITVAASTPTDVRAAFSNFGPCVDVFAPGTAIVSTFHTSRSATQVLSGTSQAVPHVAGVAAQLLQLNPILTPAQLANTLLAGATPNIIANPGPNTTRRLVRSVP